MSQRVKVRRLTDEEGRQLQRIVRRGGGKAEVNVVRYRRAMVQDNNACSVAAHTSPVGGVTRIQAVYTPPALRCRGYAGACVSALSARLHDAGHRCILYTDLANPVSNKLYRRIGYRAAVECLRYRFG